MKTYPYVTLILCLTACAAIYAKPTPNKGGTAWTLKQHSIDSGGGRIAGAEYVLTNSLGQLDAKHQSTGGTFQISGGFYHPRLPSNDLIFKDGFE